MIEQVIFSNDDVLISENDKIARKWKLERALKLGNLFKHHVEVIFINQHGERLKTTATIWAVTEAYVVLKGGKVIPINSICDIHEC